MKSFALLNNKSAKVCEETKSFLFVCLFSFLESIDKLPVVKFGGESMSVLVASAIFISDLNCENIQIFL